MRKPEEEGGEIIEAGDSLYAAMSRIDTKQSRAIRGRLIGGTIEDLLELPVEEGSKISVRQAIAGSYIQTLLEKGVTSRDMLALQKLMGEDIQKSQSVSVKLKADGGKETADFLKSISGGKDE